MEQVPIERCRGFAQADRGVHWRALIRPSRGNGLSAEKGWRLRVVGLEACEWLATGAGVVLAEAELFIVGEWVWQSIDRYFDQVWNRGPLSAFSHRNKFEN